MRKSIVTYGVIFILIALCSVFFLPFFAIAADDAPSWVGPEDHEMTRSGVTYYVSDDGTAAASVVSNGITWVFGEDSDHRTGAWFGVDNSDGIFQLGSRFYVRWITKAGDPEEYEECLNRIDMETMSKLKDGICFFEVGVESPDGNEYTVLPQKVSLFVQLGSGFDKDNFTFLYLNADSDESVPTSFAYIQSPEGPGDFAEVDVTHFGGPLLFGQKMPFFATMFIEYEPAILCVGAAVILVVAVAVILNAKKKKS